MSDKEMVMDVVRELPEESTLEEILEQVRILAALQRSAEDADAGRVISHEEVKKRAASWSTK
jgi:predicted transcriptional regulator